MRNTLHRLSDQQGAPKYPLSAYPFTEIPAFGSFITVPTISSSTSADDCDAIAVCFALQSLQYLLEHPVFLMKMLRRRADLLPALLQHLDSTSPFVASAALATFCELVSHAPSFVSPVTSSLDFAWRLRTLADRRIQPDTLALNALPLVLHLARAEPAHVCSCGLVSVVVASVHAMHECLKHDALHYLTVALQILLEVSLYPAPLSAAALRTDVLGAALKAVRLTWHADDLMQLRKARGMTVPADDQMISRTLLYIRMDAVHCVSAIKRLCNVQDRPAALPRLLAESAALSEGAKADIALLPNKSGQQDGARLSEVCVGMVGRTGSLGHSAASSSNVSMQGIHGGLEGCYRGGAASYMTLLMRAEENCPGVIAVEHALVDGEGHCCDRHPFGLGNVLTATEQSDGELR